MIFRVLNQYESRPLQLAKFLLQAYFRGEGDIIIIVFHDYENAMLFLDVFFFYLFKKKNR